jgi:hypothetical protein
LKGVNNHETTYNAIVDGWDSGGRYWMVRIWKRGGKCGVG